MVKETSSSQGEILRQEKQESIEKSKEEFADYRHNQQLMSAVRGESKEVSDWVDHGIIDVKTDKLPYPESISGPQNFDHHISWEDAKSATLQLPEIQKQVAFGKTGDDFFKEDQAAGLDYTQGKQRVYDLYYGSDPVRLDKSGDEYDIVSGRHRIFAAKYLGVSSIPAHVKEKV